MSTPLITCIAVDDEPLALKLIRDYASKMPQLQLLHTFSNALEAVGYLRERPVDLLFTDINMPDITGMDLVKSLETRPMIIFTTAHRKFAADGFDLDAVDYLVKPFAFDRFKKAVEKAQAFATPKPVSHPAEEESIFVRAEYKRVQIPLGEIVYIEALEDYIRIHLQKTKPVMTLMTLKSIFEKLPNDKFARIHRSYIIPYAGIQHIGHRKLTLLNGIELPVSESYQPLLQQWLQTK